jgi:lipid-A-disaccharide synthase
MGLAGPRMREAGVRPIVDFERLLVMGLVEIAARLPFFLKLRRQVLRALSETPPDLVIPIDYPGFNLWLSREAKRRKIRVLYYIAPQLWAWRRDRARVLADCADRVAVVFPQEEPFLREFGVQAVFVGHPCLDRVHHWETRAEALLGAGLDPARPVLGVLPGSRPQEVRRHLGPFLRVADEVVRRRPEVQVVVSGARHVPGHLYEPARRYAVAGDSVRVLRAATAVLAKSGTTTVEAALAETPLVIAHRVHPLTYALARRLVRVESVGMVNILAGRRIVPEFVQDLPVERISAELLPLLEEGSAQRRDMLEALRGVRSQLGDPGAAERVARLAAELLEPR